MSYAWAIFPAALAVAVVGFWLLDRWHRRWAWREATREAEEFRREYLAGVERQMRSRK